MCGLLRSIRVGVNEFFEAILKRRDLTWYTRSDARESAKETKELNEFQVVQTNTLNGRTFTASVSRTRRRFGLLDMCGVGQAMYHSHLYNRATQLQPQLATWNWEWPGMTSLDRSHCLHPDGGRLSHVSIEVRFLVGAGFNHRIWWLARPVKTHLPSYCDGTITQLYISSCTEFGLLRRRRFRCISFCVCPRSREAAPQNSLQDGQNQVLIVGERLNRNLANAYMLSEDRSVDEFLS
jgi:hypothetical protein